MHKYTVLLILAILLVSMSTSHAHSIKLNLNEVPLQAQACGYLTPQDIRTAYNFNQLYSQGITGAGENITIVVAYGNPNLQKDVNTYDSYYGLPGLTNNSNLFVEYPFGKPSSSYTNWTDESTLDVEVAHSLAPGANIYLVVAPNDSFLFNTVNYTIENIKTNILSLSWGSSEIGYNQQDINYLNQILANGRAKGINIFVASGDNGAYNSYNTLNVNFPASSPNVIAVGGTTLSVNSNGGYKSEIGWNQSGGGQSQFFTRPTFQPATGSYRMVPDVSFNAGTPVCMYINSQFEGFYGTSVAAPSWAALDALINQNAKSDIGYLDNTLYKIYSSVGTLVFNNITSGCNGFYCANGNYNEVTGLGSPKALQLVEAASNTTYSIIFSDTANGIFSINGRNYSSTVDLKFPFGEKVNLEAYSTLGNKSSEKDIFSSFSGIIQNNSSSIYFFVNASGNINVNFNKYLKIEERFFDGIYNKTYYIRNGSVLNVSGLRTENYSKYQYILKGFSINNGTLIQKSNYGLQVFAPLNISYYWFNESAVMVYFESGAAGMSSNISYYTHIPLSNSIVKHTSSVSNGSKIYSLSNSTLKVYGKPVIINGKRYLTLNNTVEASDKILINTITEYNYTVNFKSENGTKLRPMSFYAEFNNISERYTNGRIWAPLDTEITIFKTLYDNVTIYKNSSFYSDSDKSINITLPVSDVTIKVVTILGIPVVGAKVTLDTTNISFTNSTNIFGGVTFFNIPQKGYNATIVAYDSTFKFNSLNGISSTLSITAGLYELYMIVGVVMTILIVLMAYERLKHRKHK